MIGERRNLDCPMRQELFCVHSTQAVAEVQGETLQTPQSPSWWGVSETLSFMRIGVGCRSQAKMRSMPVGK
jgi:hypothetical protein